MSFDQDGDKGGIFARMWSPDGIGGPEFQVNDHEDNWQHDPKLASLPSGHWIAVWSSIGQGTTDKTGVSIYAKIYQPGNEANGGKEFKVNEGTSP